MRCGGACGRSIAGLPRHRIPAWKDAPEGPQLGACAQAAVVFFADFAIALLFVAAAPIPSCLQDHVPQEHRFVISSAAYGSDAFHWGARMPSEDVGERIEHRGGRGGLK